MRNLSVIPKPCPQFLWSRPTKPRKRKAPTLRADAWESYKARIVELHIRQGLPLREVKEHIKKEFGFTAEYVSFFRVEQGQTSNVLYDYALKATTISNTHKPMRSGQEYQAGGDESNRQEMTAKETRRG